jgi:hypothetical protein
VDGLQKYSVYGAGGSWANRKFRCMETHQSFGSSWHTEMVLKDMSA